MCHIGAAGAGTDMQQRDLGILVYHHIYVSVTAFPIRIKLDCVSLIPTKTRHLQFKIPLDAFVNNYIELECIFNKSSANPNNPDREL